MKDGTLKYMDPFKVHFSIPFSGTNMIKVRPQFASHNDDFASESYTLFKSSGHHSEIRDNLNNALFVIASKKQPDVKKLNGPVSMFTISSQLVFLFSKKFGCSIKHFE